MRRQLYALTFVALPLATAMAVEPGRAGSGVDRASRDPKADACTDFYQFACGDWLAANPVSADRPRRGRFQEVLDRNFTILRRILEEPAPREREGPAGGVVASPDGNGDLRKARDYYAACMDEAAITAAGTATLAFELAPINALDRRDALPELIAHLQAIIGETPPSGSTRRAGYYVFFRLGSRPKFGDATMEEAALVPDGMALPSRDYYLKTDDRSKALRNEYRRHIAQMLTLSGIAPADAASGASAVLTMETTLAKATLDVAERRDPRPLSHPLTISDLQSLTSDWPRYLTASGAPAFASLNVNEPAFMRAVNTIIGTASLPDLKMYLRWHAVHGAATRLPGAFSAATFDFFNRRLTGQEQRPPRWRECVADTDQQLGEAVGQAFVEEAFGARGKDEMLKMVRRIKDAMKREIEEAPWMSKETKAAAQGKLAAVIDRIGYPETWRDYRAVRISRTDALGNLQRALAFHNARRLAKIGRRVDRGEWNMSPATVNAYYNPSANNINFPAGILQPPFYQPGGDAATNYGAIGAVIGHELTHGFDDQGRKYDALGNLRDWWTEADGKAFQRRTGCLADQYSRYVVAGDTHINGTLTLGENTADNGGLRLALAAYLAGPGESPDAAPAVDGFTADQRFFLGWGQQWCESSRPEAERQKAAANSHSANQYRVNGVVSNMPEFRKAFSCKADAPMVRQNVCRVW
jgi:endothelin-converting enzyme/putative endopeptidase